MLSAPVYRTQQTFPKSGGTVPYKINIQVAERSVCAAIVGFGFHCANLFNGHCGGGGARCRNATGRWCAERAGRQLPIACLKKMI